MDVKQKSKDVFLPTVSTTEGGSVSQLDSTLSDAITESHRPSGQVLSQSLDTASDFLQCEHSRKLLLSYG